MHGKKACKDFEIKTLYLKSDTLLLADVFENFRKTLSKIAHLDPEKLLWPPRLVWKAALKKA